MSKECVEWGEETRSECAQYRDDGYNECSEWGKECHWYTFWNCVVEWFCVGWYWVSNIVCIAWTYITTAVCLVWETVVTIVVYIVLIVEVIVGTLISAIDFVLEVFFSIPFLGRFIRELLSLLQEIFWRLVGLLDALAYWIGIRPEKKLRVCVIILSDQNGPVADEAMVLEEVQVAVDIFRGQANVRVIPCALFNSKTPFHDDIAASDDYIHISTSPSENELLDVSCGAGAWGEDLGMKGSSINMLMSKLCFCGNARRLIGYGSPMTVFIVKSIDGNDTTGCSLGPLTDYVTVVGTETTDKTTIAHEVGHACGLWHVDTTTNLMYEFDSNDRRKMSTWQEINFRNSRHVTYF